MSSVRHINEVSHPQARRTGSVPLELAQGRKAITTLSVIVPVYNEQFLVEESLSRLRVLSDTTLLESVKIIVVDDGSSDGTSKALHRFRTFLETQAPDPKLSWVWARHEKNSGKGAAIRTGLLHVDTELVVIHDADLEYHPSDMIKIAEVFLYDDDDAVFGSRFMAGG